MRFPRAVRALVLTVMLFGTAAIALRTQLDACECFVNGVENCCGLVCGGSPCVCVGGCN